MPAPVHFAGQRLPASYANFYIANRVVLVPTFNDSNDRQALQVLADVFPTRQVVGIHAADLVLGLGTLHCMTQQQPLQQPERASAPSRSIPVSINSAERLEKLSRRKWWFAWLAKKGAPGTKATLARIASLSTASART